MDLEPEEVRVLGCLIEKEATTPDVYPLTLNSLRLACNQSSSRSPVVSYDDATVQGALQTLRERGLTRIVHSVHNRATKYRHVLDEQLRLDERELAVIGVLLLRGPQTVGELRSRTERMASFDSLGDVEQTLERLAAREEPLVRRLERLTGQKDPRWVHLLGGEPDLSELAASAPAPSRASAAVRDDGRIDELEARVASLEARLASLEDELGR